jgi:hypothetical protein
MAIWFGNRVEPITTAQKLGVWAKRVVILIAIGGALISVRTFSEDKRSHAVRESLPLLFGYSWMVYPGEGFDPAKAEWGNFNSGVSIADGQIFFIRNHRGVFAVKLFDQSLEPEQARFQFVEIGVSGPVQGGTASGSRPIELPGQSIPWSGSRKGRGFIYLSERFLYGMKNTYQFGAPFRSGDLQQFQFGLPPGIQFNSLASRINEANGVVFDSQGFDVTP